jgi:hypothetical protein
VAKQIKTGESAWYYIMNIFWLGLLYFLKIVIKRAIIESENQRDE